MMSSSKYGMKIVRKNFSTSLFSHLKPRPADPILGIVEEFKKDKDAKKVNLSAGTYKDNEGKPYILNCVRAAEKLILDKKIDHEYLPIEGLQGFIKNSLKVAYAEDNQALKEDRIVGVQGLSGTGSLRLGFEFFATNYPGNKTVFIPNPSWPNHKNIVARSGMEFKEYRYYDSQNKSLNLNGMLEDLDKAPEKSIVILHVCAHNPTGMDPTESQWEDIYKVIAKKNHLPFFDMAYQGFASGDLTKDSFALRKFANSGMKLALAQSYAKNFGLYGERIGCFSLICDSQEEAKAVESHVKFIARAQYSNPPKYGAHLVDIVLSDPTLTAEWHKELLVMSERINSMRQALFNGLKANGSTLNWDHIVKQIGMFAYTGLNLEQVKRLKSEFHIYLTDDGRISISGLNTKNVDYVAKSFHEVSKL
jgi:aspartate aminotransferase, mitochondrial